MPPKLSLEWAGDTGAICKRFCVMEKLGLLELAGILVPPGEIVNFDRSLRIHHRLYMACSNMG